MKKKASKLVVGLVAINVLASVPITAMAADASEGTPKITIKESGKTALKSGLTATQTNLVKNSEFHVNTSTGVMPNWYYYNAVDKQELSYGARIGGSSPGWGVFQNSTSELDIIASGGPETPLNTGKQSAHITSVQKSGYYHKDATFYVAQGVSTVPGKKYSLSVNCGVMGVNTMTSTVAVSNDRTFTDLNKIQTATPTSGLIEVDFIANNEMTYIGLGNSSTSNPQSMSTLLYFEPVVNRVIDTPTISALTTQDTNVTVTGEANTKTTIVLPDGSEMAKTADAEGKASFIIPKQEAGSTVSAYQSDSDASSEQVSTKVELPAPKITPVNDKSTSVTVTGDAGAEITVTLPDGSRITKVANAQGQATFAVSDLEANQVIKATQSKNDQTSPVTTTTVQAAAINAPTIAPFTTADTQLVVTGEAGARISVTLPDGSDMNKTADASGKATFNIGKQELGAVIEATQTGANGKVSEKSSITVTGDEKPVLNAPTINDYYATAAYVTGKAPAGASRIALYVDNQLVRYGAIDSNGNYQIYAADNAKMNTAGKAFQVVALDSDGNMGTKANSTVKAKLAAPAIQDYFTTDVYAKGTATGANKVTLYVNGKAVRTAAVNANGSYSIYTGDQASLTSAGATFQISATNTAGMESAKTSATVKSKLTAPVINKYVASDAYARGTASAGSKQVVLYVNGKAVRTAAVNADGSYAIYTGDQASLTTAGNTFQISSKDAAGNESPKATGTVVSVLAAPVISPYYTSDVYAKGTTSATASKVALYVDGKFVRYATVTDGKYSIYTGDQAKLSTAGNTFQIAAVDANGIIGSMATGTVLVDNRVATKLTADSYNLASDQTVSGQAGTDIARVKIYVNGELKRQTNVVDGAYGIYAKDVITKVSDDVVIVGYDAQGYERNRVAVSVTNEAPKTYNLTANEFNLAKDETVTGTSDAGITRVQLVVNDVVVRATATSNGSYAIYAEDQIKAGDKVEIVGLDSSNIARKTVSVSVVNNTPVAKTITVADYTIGTENITGTFDPEVKKVQLFVNGAFVRQAAISGNNFTVYAADKVTSTSQTVEMVGFDASGAENARQAVNVK
ncbi:immunoglobulin-like domain-containing protein [Listeria seeligeri]|uniref:immunoglobulin-like domain-containing protein n=1 Tax=Listeria seeligeri TaxID=1640 RepID=UPI001943F2FD|nr:immunoglobulin-like domain-containing protein [Listeria seeligeri]MBM5677953.1 hypothetical protein [Listeria seeligeri]